MSERNVASGRASRVGRLKLSTALGGGAAAILLLAPAVSAAPVSPYRIVAPTLPGATAKAAAPADSGLDFVNAPQDLTISSPVRATASVGDVVITDGDITTTGDFQPGITSTSTGSTTITAGNITTSGKHSDGVDASGPGPIAITVGNVSTSGNDSAGIHAAGGGDIAVTTGDVTTTGGRSSGIYAHSSGGNVTVNAGNVYAVGSVQSWGIDASGHDVTITAGNVKGGAIGISARGYGQDAAVDLTVTGTVSSYSFTGHGISAISDGSVTIHDSGSIFSTSITSIGFGEGIYAHGGGDVLVDSSGRIKTYGRQIGIAGFSDSGNVTIDASVVDAYGSRSIGIEAFAAGKATIVADDIVMANNQSGGIVAGGASVDVTLNGMIDAKGQSTNGIIAIAYSGDAAIHNNGAITVGNLAGYGIQVTAAGNITIDGKGSVATGRYHGYGIVAFTAGGSISITQGDITANNYGVMATAQTQYYQKGDPSRGITIDVGNVKTTGTGVTATGIVANDRNVYSTVAINAASVSTIGDYAAGIRANAAGGTVTVTGGSITTRGNHAAGVSLIGNDYDSVTLNSITTTGSYHSSGIEIQTNPFHYGTITVDVGSISTGGYLSHGLVALSSGSADIKVGSITTTGTRGFGIYALGSTDVSINVGSIATTGEGSTALIGLSRGGTLSISESSSITTQGDNALAVIAETGGNGAIDLTLDGAISTKGKASAGVVVVAGSGAIQIKAGSISTAGVGAPALAAYSFYGSANVDIGSASTGNVKSPAVLVVAGTDATVTAGQLSTSGDNSNALVIRAGSYGVGGEGVVNVNTIVTSGRQSAGIDALAQGDAKHDASISLTAGSITTSGIDSPGISAFADYGALNIQAGSIKTTGYESTGIMAFGGKDIGIQVGSVDTAATSIYASGSGTGTITLGVTGKVASSGGHGAVLINSGGATNVTVASTGSIAGAGDALQIQTGTGQVTITNAGTITGGSGYAIDVSGLPAPMLAFAKLGQASVAAATPGAQIVNSGTIVGAVSLTGGDDVLTNSGTFVATKDSDFGAGNDLFVNSGKLVVQPGTKPGNITLLGLETFQNSGLVDLRNGVAGDTLTLPGNYIASGKAALGLDLGANGIADKLIVNGTVTGTTSILINATAGNATLLATPVTLVQAGGTSMAANAFSIANQSVGFVTYGLSYNAATNSFQLTAQAGAPVYRFAKVNEAAQAIGQQVGTAWRSHMAELRDMDEPARRVWGQAYGQVDSRHEDRTVAVAGSTAQNYDLGYRQDYFGAQAGVDLGGKRAENGNGLLFGITGGYLSSHMNFRAGADRVRFDTVNAGGYAGVRAGRLFANLLGQYVHYRTTAFNGVEQWSDKFSGNGYGVQGEVGARLGSDTLFAEPVASLAWQKTDLGTLNALGQSLDFGHDSGLTGSFGARFGGSVAMAGGGKAVFYAKASYVHAFSGKGGVLFTSGGTSEDISGTKLGDYGQAAVGADFLTTGRVSGFIEANADV
ncbi:MAG TPA: hypothetical protein VKQ27_00700, partial [Acetobacteraceae bacterium]|nr:hypothetical protein [Acetobacteraceae bacterium]